MLVGGVIILPSDVIVDMLNLYTAAAGGINLADEVQRLDRAASRLLSCTLQLEKMAKGRSEYVCHASSISQDDVDSIKSSLRCVAIGSEDEFEGELGYDTDVPAAANKHEPQQQEA